MAGWTEKPTVQSAFFLLRLGPVGVPVAERQAESPLFPAESRFFPTSRPHTVHQSDTPLGPPGGTLFFVISPPGFFQPFSPQKRFSHGPNAGRLPPSGRRPALRRLLIVIACLWPQLLLADFTRKVVSVADGDTVTVLRGTEQVTC